MIIEKRYHDSAHLGHHGSSQGTETIAKRPEESVRGVYQLDVRKGASGMSRKRIMLKGLSGKLKVGRHGWNVKVGREAKGKQESTEL